MQQLHLIGLRVVEYSEATMSFAWPSLSWRQKPRRLTLAACWRYWNLEWTFWKSHQLYSSPGSKCMSNCPTGHAGESEIANIKGMQCCMAKHPARTGIYPSFCSSSQSTGTPPKARTPSTPPSKPRLPICACTYRKSSSSLALLQAR